MEILSPSNSSQTQRPAEIIDFTVTIYDTIIHNMNFLHSTLMNMVGKNVESENTNKILKNRVFNLEKDLQHSQQYGRRENIEIIGIPAHIHDRDLERYVIYNILHKIGMNTITDKDIHACHRLKKKRWNKPANVILRFKNRKDAHLALEGRNRLKSFPHLRSIYIVENLCPKYQQIFDRCVELVDEKRISHVWTYNGIVHYKIVNNRRARGTKLFHIDELDSKFPPIDIEPDEPRDELINNQTVVPEIETEVELEVAVEPIPIQPDVDQPNEPIDDEIDGVVVAAVPEIGKEVDHKVAVEPIADETSETFEPDNFLNVTVDAFNTTIELIAATTAAESMFEIWQSGSSNG